MAFPHDDPAWAAAAEFLRPRLAPQDRLLAPDPFRYAIPRAQGFAQRDFVQAAGAAAADFAWVVVHKGEVASLPFNLLAALPQVARAVFANDVFVIFANPPPEDLPDLAETPHVGAFWAARAAILRDGPPPPAVAPPAAPPRTGAARPWLGRDGSSARESAFQEELDRVVIDHLGDCAGLAVLDVGCGAGRLGALAAATQVVGIDTNATPLGRAATRHAHLPQFGFAAMDAASLGFADASFDVVVLRDSLDSLADPAAALAEAARVLARGGRLLITAANSQNLVARAQRRVGLPTPSAGFAILELTGMLRAAGLVVTRSDGIWLAFGWGLAGADPALAALEEDPEFIEAARILGRRAGPELALGFVLLARRA